MALSVIIYASPGAPHQLNAANLLFEGFRRHGINAQVKPRFKGEACDLAVCWGHRKHDLFHQQRQSGGNYLVMERAYFGERHHWTSLGFNGLNGRARFPKADDAGARWRRHFADMLQPWKADGGDYVLLIGQVPGDAALHNVDINQWYLETLEALASQPLPVKFRPHPVALQKGIARFPVGVEIDTAELHESLKRAAYVVTFSSNTAVDAVVAGIPAIATDAGSMAWAVTGHDLHQTPPRPVRTFWANELAYAQWLPEEIASGEAWEHLKTCILN